MPLQNNADGSLSTAPVHNATLVAAPRFNANSTPLKALVGGVLIGVVVGGFVSPMAGKISGHLSSNSAAPAPYVAVQATGSARSMIQDARVATSEEANSTAVPAGAEQPPLTLSNAGSETDR